MKLIRSLVVTEAMVTSNVPETAPAEWDGVTTFAAGELSGVTTGTVTEVYESLQDGNLNNDPASSPAWWQWIGTVYAPWNVGTTYAAGDYVTRNHKVFLSLQAGNLGNDPETSVAFWQDRGATNLFAPFDAKTGTKASRPGPLTYTIAATGRVDTIGLEGIAAASVTVVMEVGGEEVFNETISMVSSAGITSWYRWLFEPIVRRKDLYLEDLPNYANPTITITLNGDGETVSIGRFTLGYSRWIGTTEWGGEAGIVSYSTKEKDEFQNWYFVDRGSAKSGRLRAVIPGKEAESVFDLLTEYDAVPTLYIGSELRRSHNFYGILTDWKIEHVSIAESILTANYEAI